MAAMFFSPRSSWAGTWTPLNNTAPDNIDTMLLLPNGDVMAASGSPQAGGVGNAWYLLTPDANGSYVNGSWTNLAPMNFTRLYYSSQVLPDDQVLVAGGEDGTGTNTVEIYDPQANTWTVTPPPPAGQIEFANSISEIVSNGDVLVAPAVPTAYGGTVFYEIDANLLNAGPTLTNNAPDEEGASWVKLPDGSILTIDPPGGTNSERYIPSLNKWIPDANPPTVIYDPVEGEMGPAFLLPNGKAFFVGGTGDTLLYTPSGTTNKGVWQAGPVIPNSQVSGDAPGAAMANGNILYAVSDGIDGTNTSFYEYNPTGNSFTQVNAPIGSTLSQPTDLTRMLDLPDGTVLFSDSTGQLYVYQSTGSPLAAGQPTISTLTTNSDGSYHLTGTLFNGISEGAGCGSDAQMDSNYPLVRMTNNSTGQVFYARVRHWSGADVMTGTNVVSADFVLPPFFQAGTYSLVVVANGNPSAPVSFSYSHDPLLVNGTNFVLVATNGGGFSVPSISLTVTNSGSASLNWSLGSTSSWFTVSSASGTVTPGGPVDIVTASLTPSAANIPFATYQVPLWFTNLSDDVVQTQTLLLQVNPPQLIQNGGFETGDFTGWTFANPSDEYDYNIVSGPYEDFYWPYAGNYCALMGQEGLPLAYISESLPTTNGQSYLFSSWIYSPDGETPNECSIAWDTDTLFNETNMPALNWTNLQFIVTATGSSSVIQFGFRDDISYLGLDNVSVTAVNAPVFQSLTRSNGSVTLTWSAQTGLQYQLQYTTNLTQTAWTNLDNPISSCNGIATATDTAPSGPQRFYRLVLLP